MTRRSTIRWGIAGTGGIASHFADDIALADGASLAGVVSRDSERGAAFAARHGSIRSFRSLDEMARSDAIDAVYIASLNHVHLEQALQVIACGKPVLVEKPLTLNPVQARQLADAARAAGVFAMEAMWSRYLPAIRAARKMIRDGLIGPLVSIDADIAWQPGPDAQSRFLDPEGGGALLDLGVYAVSLSRFFLGEPDRIQGEWQAAETGVDIAASLTLGFGDAVARLHCGFNYTGSNRMVIEGTRGILVLGPPFIKADAVEVFSSRRLARLLYPSGSRGASGRMRALARKLPLPGKSRNAFPLHGTGLQFEIMAASDAIRNGLTEEVDCTLADSIRTLEILASVLQTPAMRSGGKA